MLSIMFWFALVIFLLLFFTKKSTVDLADGAVGAGGATAVGAVVATAVVRGGKKLYNKMKAS